MIMDKYEWLRKMQLQIAVALAIYPLHWLAAAWLDSSRIGSTWLLSLVAVVAGAIAFRVPGKLRSAFGAAVCMILLSASLLFDETAGRRLWIVESVFSSVHILWSLPLAASDSKTELPGYWISAGIASHVTTQVLLLTDWGAGLPGWMLRTAFFCYVLLVMLSVNRRSLLDASGKRKAVPGALKRRNMLLTVALFGVSLLGGFLPSAIDSVKDAIVRVLQWAGEMIEKLFSKIGRDGGNTTQQAVSELTPAVREGGQMRQLHPILETIILYIGAAISVVLLAMILYRIGRKILRFMRESLDLFGKFMSASTEDYVDEVTDIRDTGESEQISRRKRRRIRYKDDPSLSPSAQVRRRYQYLKYDHKDWAPGATAREKLPVQAASIYEHARYSDRSVSSEDAKAFLDIARDL